MGCGGSKDWRDELPQDLRAVNRGSSADLEARAWLRDKIKEHGLVEHIGMGSVVTRVVMGGGRRVSVHPV